MSSVPSLPLEPLAYHLEVVRTLKAHEAELWGWFSAEKLRAEQGEAVRLELLKSTYRLEPEAHPALHAAAGDVAATLGARRAAHALPGAGPGRPQRLPRLRAGRGSPRASRAGGGPPHPARSCGRCSVTSCLHFVLLDRWTEYLVASQVLSAMASDEAAEPAHVTTARRFGLYTEVYCDRGAHLACGDLASAVSALVKIETGIAEVSAESYLRQADEIFGKGHPRTEGVTHPETFVRARALRLWAESPERAPPSCGSVIEGPPSLADLDLPGQQRIAALTRRLVAALLRPAWLQTDPLLAHARLFFEDFEPLGGARRRASPPTSRRATRSSSTTGVTSPRLRGGRPRPRGRAARRGAAPLRRARPRRALPASSPAKELGLRKKQLEALEPAPPRSSRRPLEADA